MRQDRSRSYTYLAILIATGAILVFYSDEFSISRRVDEHQSELLKSKVDEEVIGVLQRLGFDDASELLQSTRKMTNQSLQVSLANANLKGPSSTNETSAIKLLSIIEEQKQQIDYFRKSAETTQHGNNSAGGTLQRKVVDDVNSNTGKLFKGDRFRDFQGSRVFEKGWENRIPVATATGTTSSDVLMSNKCRRWGVVTTIFDPTLAVRRVSTMEGWCLVIVADTKTPKGYLEDAGLEGTDTIKFWTVEEQQQLANSTDRRMREFVSAIPYRHFARKNLGFLFAIRNGAEYIFDFDDDNIVNLDQDGKPEMIIPAGDVLKNVSVPLLGKSVFNPYPLMEPSHPDSWPRGLPLEAVAGSRTSGTIRHYKDVPLNQIGVIQYLADVNPDIDAVHRLTKILPMTFRPDSNFMLVPTHAYVPYNAQATIHTKDALWATLLPFTVPGRVSDIWRSYFAEALFREVGLKVIFGPPLVVQDRNEHNILADMQAELDLYFKAGKLIEFLDNWKPVAADSVPGLMEDLWIGLYERGYIGLADVELVQLWLAALVESGYVFPDLTKLRRRRRHDVAIMGQFNRVESINHILLWTQRWKEVFPHVVIRAPLSEAELEEVRAHGIDAHNYPVEENARYLSPMDNLARTLVQFQHHEDVKAVFYTDSDGLVNARTLLSNPSHTENDVVEEIVGTQLGVKADLSYMDPRQVMDLKEKAKFIYKIHRDGTFENASGQKFDNAKDFVHTLESWDMYHLDWCLKAQQQLAMSLNVVDAYREAEDGSVLFAARTKANMLLVPTSLTMEFVNVTQIFTDAGVGLECSAGTIVDMVRRWQRQQATLSKSETTTTTTITSTRVIPFCSRGTMEGHFPPMDGPLMNCDDSDNEEEDTDGDAKSKFHGYIYPISMEHGLREWDEQFDNVVFDD